MDSILIFGAGELQCSLINTVKRMGFRAVVIDPDPDAEGRDIADVFFRIAADDYEGTRKIAQDFGVVSLVTSATDNPLPLMAKLAEELGLRFPSYESVMTVLDKNRFKKLMIENNIPCAKGQAYDENQYPDYAMHNYPVIIKPNRNSGSRGVIRCNSSDELEAEIQQVKQYCRDGKYIVEEFIEGDEISVEGLVINGKLEIIQITDKILGPPPYNVEMGHIQPSKYWPRRNEINDILQKIITVTGLNYCAVHPELKINKNGIFIIEIGPRLGGDFITSDLVPLSTGFNMERALINLSLGVQFAFIRRERVSMIKYLAYPCGSLVKGTIDERYLKTKFKGLRCLKLYISIGQITQQVTNSMNRHGYWIIDGLDIKNVLIKSKAIQSEITSLTSIASIK